MPLKLYEKNNNAADLQRTTDILDNGGIIICPTDTMYTIGCHGLKECAVEHIYQLKVIDPKKSNLSIIYYDLGSINEYTKFDDNTFKLVKHSLSGPFIFILNGTIRLPKVFRNRKEVGICTSDNPIIQELVRFLDAPVTTTTLLCEENEGIGYCTDPESIDEKFSNIIDLAIDGSIDDIESSTIADRTSGRAETVRQGKGQLGEG